MTKAILVILGVVVIGYAALSWEFADRLIGGQFLPQDEEADFAEYGLPEPEAVTIANGDVELSAWYFANPDTAGCAVVVTHGFSGNKAQMLAPGAKLFFERGCDILVYDLRGHGASSRGLLTYGYFDKEDQIAVIDWLMERTGLPDERIGLWGVSYGAATSIQTAAARPGLGFVIADASYSSMPDIAAVQADKQIGVWARAFIPGALAVAGWRAGFDPSEASPEGRDPWPRSARAAGPLDHRRLHAVGPVRGDLRGRGSRSNAADPDASTAPPTASRSGRRPRSTPAMSMRSSRTSASTSGRASAYSMTRFGGRSSPAG